MTYLNMRLFSFSCLLGSLLLPATLFAQELEINLQDQMYLEADSLEVTGPEDARTIEAIGNSRFTSGDVEIRSKTMRYDQQSGLLGATGDVTATQGTDQFQADAIQYHARTRQAEVSNATLAVPQDHLFLDAEEFWLMGEGQYAMRGGLLSTCTCNLPQPPAYMTATTITVNRNGYARLRKPVIWIEGVPVLASPWLILPVGSERRSGLLFPRFGFSARDGFKIVPAFVIVPGARSEIYGEALLETRRGVGGTLHGAYSTVALEGSLTGTYLAETFRTSATSTAGIGQRWTIETHHRAAAGTWGRFKLDALVLSDSNVFEDFANSLEEVSQERATVGAEVYGAHRWGGASVDFTLLAQQGSADSTRFQRFPRIAVSSFMPEPVAGFHLASDLSFAELYFRQAVTGFALQPAAFVRQGHAIRLHSQVQQTALQNGAGGLALRAGNTLQVRTLDTENQRTLYPTAYPYQLDTGVATVPWGEARLELRLARTYHSNGLSRAILHTVRPWASAWADGYFGASALDPLFLSEFQPHQKRAILSAGVAQQFATRSIAANLNLWATAVTADNQLFGTAYKPETAARLHADVQGTYLGLTWQAAANADGLQRTDHLLDASWWRLGLGAGYTWTRLAPDTHSPIWAEAAPYWLQQANTQVGHEIYGKLKAPIARRADVTVDARYSIPRQEVTTWGAGLTLHSSCECWVLSLRWRDLPDPAADQFGLAFQMEGIGGTELD